VLHNNGNSHVAVIVGNIFNQNWEKIQNPPPSSMSHFDFGLVHSPNKTVTEN
jgi:hypothetical protein